MTVIVGAVLLACWFVFLHACWRFGQNRKIRRESQRWYHDRDLYRRERNR